MRGLKKIMIGDIMQQKVVCLFFSFFVALVVPSKAVAVSSPHFPLIQEINYSEGQCVKKVEPVFCLTIKQTLDYSALKDNSMEYILTARRVVSNRASKLRGKQVKEFQSVVAGGRFGRYQEDRLRVVTIVNRVLVLNRSVSIFTGNSPYVANLWEYFDMETGSIISLNSLLTSNGDDRLKKAIFKAIGQLPVDRRKCFFESFGWKNVPIPNSFVFTSDSLEVHYPHYSLASRACGEFIFSVKLSDIPGAFHNNGQWENWRPRSSK